LARGADFASTHFLARPVGRLVVCLARGADFASTHFLARPVGPSS
jgi:hypothetical protein